MALTRGPRSIQRPIGAGPSDVERLGRAAIKVVSLCLAGALVVHAPPIIGAFLGLFGLVGAVALIGFERLANIAWAGAMLFAPLNTIRVTSFASVADVFIIIAVTATLLSGLIRGRPAKGRPSARLAAGLLLIAFGGTVGTFFAGSASTSLDEISRFVLASLGSVAAFAFWAPDRTQLRRMAWMWLGGAIVDATWGVTGGGRVYGGRIYGFSGQPNLVGLTCLLGIGLAIGLAMSSERWRAKVALVACAPLLVALVQSGSRAALLGLFVMIPAIAVLTHRLRLLVGLAAFACLLLVAILGGIVRLPSGTSVGRLTGSTSTRLSDSARSDLLRTGIEEFKRHPFTGEGFEQIRAAHNIYLEILVAAGPIGIVGLYLSAGDILMLGVRGARRWHGPMNGESALGLAAIGGYVGYLVLGLLQPILWERSLWLYVALAVGLVQSSALSESIPAQAPDRVRGSEQPKVSS